MDKSLLQLITDRVSIPAAQLTEPAPNKKQLEQIINAAISVPDHGALVPYRFIVIEKEARNELSKLFVNALKISQPNASGPKVLKQSDKPLRAPMIIVCVSSIKENNIPAVEQKACASAAVMQMMLAANALNFHNVWLTGGFCYDSTVKEGLGLTVDEEIMGFVYMGSAIKVYPSFNRPNVADVLSQWQKIKTFESSY